jgi:hypothetical protein
VKLLISITIAALLASGWPMSTVEPRVATVPRAASTPGNPDAAGWNGRPEDRNNPPPAPAKVTRGFASWCAPTRDKCRNWGGNAKLAAVPSFGFGDGLYPVHVCRADKPRVCTDPIVVSFCSCGTHVIDLSPASFRELAPLSVGVVKVTVSPAVPLPPNTDTAP